MNSRTAEMQTSPHSPCPVKRQVVAISCHANSQQRVGKNCRATSTDSNQGGFSFFFFFFPFNLGKDAKVNNLTFMNSAANFFTIQMRAKAWFHTSFKWYQQLLYDDIAEMVCKTIPSTEILL